MRIAIVGALCLMEFFLCTPAWAGLWRSCDGETNEPRPDWVSKLDYSLPDFYVGVSSAEKENGSKEGRSLDELRKVSESNARSNLAQRIEVKVNAENRSSTKVTNQGVLQDAQSNVSVSADEVLRGLATRAQWVDKDTCALYTLVVVKKEAVNQAKREKLMKIRFEKFREQLAEGEDRNKNPALKVRRLYLENAQALLADIDTSLLQAEAQGKVYVKRMSDALALLNQEMSQVNGRMALVALNQDGSLRANVMGKMLDQLRAGDSRADRLQGDCQTEEACLSLASERGFSKLALLKASSTVGISQMGAYKGTLTITRTVFDIESHKKQGTNTVSAQVIGWSNEELDWLSAVDKAMQDLQ